jgi:uncharacterized membrane protein
MATISHVSIACLIAQIANTGNIMKEIQRFVFDTFNGGFFFLIPLFVLLMVVQKVWEFFQDLGGNLARMLGFDQLAGVASASILSALVILLVCFLFGLLARWSAAGIVRHWLESSLKRIFPLTTTTIPLLSKLELTDKPARPAVLLRRPGGWQPGILVEEYANGEKVVFVPLSPKTTDGDVYLAGPEDVRPSTLNENTLNVVLLKQGKGLVPSET